MGYTRRAGKAHRQKTLKKTTTTKQYSTRGPIFYDPDCNHQTPERQHSAPASSRVPAPELANSSPRLPLSPTIRPPPTPISPFSPEGYHLHALATPEPAYVFLPHLPSLPPSTGPARSTPSHPETGLRLDKKNHTEGDTASWETDNEMNEEMQDAFEQFLQMISAKFQRRASQSIGAVVEHVGVCTCDCWWGPASNTRDQLGEERVVGRCRVRFGILKGRRKEEMERLGGREAVLVLTHEEEERKE
uniref:Uncharacterized protein n=1 Tax=Timema monikensis TaxID=170555 RepID=A0A7R9EJ61_9NEOP|nr:unnamed protein product [Timema monikensis]